MSKLLRVALAALVATAGAVVATPTASAQIDVYATPGYHTINGREWRTACEPYSITYRCRTEIKATVVNHVGGRFVQKTGWAFNNLTYLASPRANWAANPLGRTGAWTASDSRQWRTECDTPTTGGNGCRSYIQASVIERTPTGFAWVKKEIFNSMVRFGAIPADPGPVDPTEGVMQGPLSPRDVPASIAGWNAEYAEGSVAFVHPTRDAAVLAMSFPDGGGLDFWAMAMEDTRKLSPNVVCGTPTGEADEVCAFSSAKFGIVLTGGIDVTSAELDAITRALAAHLA